VYTSLWIPSSTPKDSRRRRRRRCRRYTNIVGDDLHVIGVMNDVAQRRGARTSDNNIMILLRFIIILKPFELVFAAKTRDGVRPKRYVDRNLRIYVRDGIGKHTDIIYR